MPREFNRSDRAADAIQRELAEVIREQMRDPRLGMANITAVEVSRDLSSAKVFVNFVAADSQQAIDESLRVLNGAAGFLRSQLAGTVRMRTVPKLRFLYDASSERGRQLSALIDRAVASDRSRDGGEEE